MSYRIKAPSWLACRFRPNLGTNHSSKCLLTYKFRFFSNSVYLRKIDKIQDDVDRSNNDEAVQIPDRRGSARIIRFSPPLKPEDYSVSAEYVQDFETYTEFA